MHIFIKILFQKYILQSPYTCCFFLISTWLTSSQFQSGWDLKHEFSFCIFVTRKKYTHVPSVKFGIWKVPFNILGTLRALFKPARLCIGKPWLAKCRTMQGLMMWIKQCWFIIFDNLCQFDLLKSRDTCRSWDHS